MPMVNCANCKKEFNKRETEIRKTNNNFCSRSCASTFNNKVKAKRPRTNKCKICQDLILSGYTYCSKCIKLGHHLRGEIVDHRRTLKSMLRRQGKDANRYNLIRYHARKVMKDMPQICLNCGYDKHVECCHIKDISSFSEDSTMHDVNSLDNLILLCPNCHWEFDHLEKSKNTILNKKLNGTEGS